MGRSYAQTAETISSSILKASAFLHLVRSTTLKTFVSSAMRETEFNGFSRPKDASLSVWLLTTRLVILLASIIVPQASSQILQAKSVHSVL